MPNLNRIPTWNTSADEDLFPDTPTDAELIAAIERGIKAGTIIEVTDELLTQWATDLEAS
jgi:hypothetical protein